jgi:diguanylate cyclase (GGDEF)-like protein/PAS domain S-box-containing protein
MSNESFCQWTQHCPHHAEHDGQVAVGAVQVQPGAVTDSATTTNKSGADCHDGVGTVRLKRRKIFWCNAEYARLFGCGPKEMIGKSATVLYQAQALLDACRTKPDSAFEQGEVVSLLLQIKHKDGTLGWYEARGEPVTPKSDESIWALIDVTENKLLEEKTQQLAFQDPLTSLPNRRLLNDRLSLALDIGKRTGRYGALMVIDLDGFKLINDSAGHEAGDSLLVEAGRRINASIRKIDTVARIGGDEFVVIVNELDIDLQKATYQANVIANKIREALEAPHQILRRQAKGEGQATEFECKASIGVVMFPSQSSDGNDYVNWADAAMYRAKKAGGNQVSF